MKSTNVIFSLLLSLLLLSLGCSRSAPERAATITFQAPKGALDLARARSSSFPPTKKACYAINITGNGITENTSSCSPKTGLLQGFVGEGAALSATVPFGNENFDIYALLVDAETPCPQLTGSKLDQFGVAYLYAVGHTDNVTVNQPTMSVLITVSFPGYDQNVVVAQAIPASCNPTLPSSGTSQLGTVSLGSSLSAGNSYEVGSAVTLIPQAQTAGKHYQIKATLK